MEESTENNLPAPLIRSSVLPDPFSLRPETYEWEYGDTIQDILFNSGVKTSSAVQVAINGNPIDRRYWHVARPKPGTLLTVTYIPKGGDQAIVRSLAIIALAVAAATVVGPFAGAAFSGGAWFSPAAAAIGSAAFFAVGMIAVNAFLPLQEAFENGDDSSQSLSVQAPRNKIEPYGTLPVVLGYMRFFPAQAALPFTEVVGSDQYVTMLLSMSYRNLEVYRGTERLGDDLLSNFSDIQLEYVTGGSTDDPALTLYTNATFEESVNVQIPQEPVYLIRSTAENINAFNVDVFFPSGLFFIPKDGDGTAQVRIYVDYRAFGTSDPWTRTEHLIRAESKSSFRKTLEVTGILDGQYEVRVSTLQETCSGCIPQGAQRPTYNEVWWQTLRSFSKDAVVCDLPCLGLANLRIKATEQISGVPDTFNVECQSIIPDWDGGAWIEAPSANPASLIRWILISGCLNARPMATSRLDNQAFVDFWNWCDTNNWTYNRVVDSKVTVNQIIHDIASSARGRVLQIDGIWTIVIDQPQALTRQYFTPRNTISFQSELLYPEEVHAFRCRFISAQEQWKNSERTVYFDGFDADTATKFEGLSPSPGITDPDQLWKIVRYFIKIAELQREVHTLTLDVENLICTPGDRVTWQEDSLLIGISTGRIKSFTATSLTLDAQMEFDDAQPNGTYGFTVRHKDGTADTFPVDTPATSPSATFTFAAGPVVAEDDLALFGEVGKISQDLQVRDIIPGQDLTAKLLCVPYDERIYDVDSEIPPIYDPVVTPPLDVGYPQILQVRSGALVMNSPDVPVMVVSVLPVGDVSRSLGLKVEWRLYDATQNDGPWLSQTIGIGEDGIIQNVIVGSTYEIRVSYIYPGNLRSQFDTTTHTVEGWVVTLPGPETMSIAHVGQMRELSWTYAVDAEFPDSPYGWEIRYMLESDAASIPVNIYAEDGEAILVEDDAAIPPDDTIHAQYTQPLAPDWQQMTKLVDGIITENPFSTSLPDDPQLGNIYIFAVKTVDAYGNESPDPPAYTIDSAATVKASAALTMEPPP